MGGLLNMVKAISCSEQNGFILRLKDVIQIWKWKIYTN